MFVPNHVSALRIELSIYPVVAFIPDLNEVGNIPSVFPRIGRSLHLFVRGSVNRLIGIIAVGIKTRVAADETGRVRHRCIDGVAKKGVISAERMLGTRFR